MSRVKYSQFVDRLDVEALCEAIGFDPEYEDGRGNLCGYCIWPENHTHGDTTGKFAIHPEKKAYNCYVCGGGSLLSLVMEFYNWDSETAEAWLYQFAGDQRDDHEFVDDFLSAFAQDVEKRVETMPHFNGRVLDKYEPAYEWGESIGLNAHVIDQYCVLYAPEAVKRSPQKGKFAEDSDYVGPAILWPHHWNKRLVGWQSRWLANDRPEWVKKWTNTVDFPKESTIYGYELVRNFQPDLKQRPLMREVPQVGKIYVVESAKTVLKLGQLGFLAVGTFGSNINDAQLRLLRKFRHGVVLCPDNDKAGGEWYINARDYLKRYVPLEGVAPVQGTKGDLADLSDVDALSWILDNTVDLTVPYV